MNTGKTPSQENIAKEDIFILRPYTHKELAQLYNVCWLTFQRWIKKHEHNIGKKQVHFYSINQFWGSSRSLNAKTIQDYHIRG